MDASRFLLTAEALRCRAHADELLLASRAARMNAERLEQQVCTGTDEEVIEELRKLETMWSAS